MLEEHPIGTTQARQANSSGLGMHRKATALVADACESSTAPFYCDWIRSELRANRTLGATKDQRDHSVFAGDDQNHPGPAGTGPPPRKLSIPSSRVPSARAPSS